jgi:hypothetical protein
MHWIDKQLREIDINLTVAATLFLFWALLIMIIIYPLFSLLVDNRFDEGDSTMTVDMWNAALPEWVAPLYQLPGHLLCILFIWIILNVVQGICLAIDTYQRKKKAKYQYQFSWRGY